MAYRRTITLTTLRVVEEYDDDETPSLPGMPVEVETTAEPAPNEPAALAKCRPTSSELFPYARKAVSR